MKTLIDHFSVPDLIHSTFRYCLGRQTAYSVTFAQKLAEAWPLLPPAIAGMIQGELETAFGYDDFARRHSVKRHLPLGQDMDRAAWELVRKAYQ
jgi:hypothetical protein